MKHWKRTAGLTLPAVLLTIMLSACSTTPTEDVKPSAVCDQGCEVQWSPFDTPETVVQNRENNAAYRAVCPPKPCKFDLKDVEAVGKAIEVIRRTILSDPA